jgi:hypothetical protein
MIDHEKLRKEQSAFYKIGYKLGYRDGLADRERLSDDELDERIAAYAKCTPHSPNE